MFTKGKWIWPRGEISPDTYAEFYRDFFASDEANIKISCDSDYTLFINGKYVSSNQYGDFEHYKSVDKIDISPFLEEGKNSLALLVWYFGEDTQRYKKYSPGVIFEVEDKCRVTLASDASILSRKSKAYMNGRCKAVSSQLGFSYGYDSTKEDSWLSGEGCDFSKSLLVNKDCTFIKRPNEKLKLRKAVLGKKISNSPIIYDLSREYVGLLTFKIKCPKKTKLEISYGEVLIDGHVKKTIFDRSYSIDYVAKEGENIFTNYMFRFACRYLQIEGDGEFTIEEIGIIPQYYDTTAKKNIFTGIDYDIYGICLNTLNLCMMEHYVDCPWREQCLYVFDSRNQMLCGYYAYEDGNFDYAKSNLLLINQDRRDDGLLSICYPCGADLTIPSFSLYYLISVNEYIKYSRDVSIISQVKHKLDEILSTFFKNMKNGLACKFSGENHWNFYDWSLGAEGKLFHNEESVPDGYINCLLLYALNSYKEICQICNLHFKYDEEIVTLKNNILKEFYDPEICVLRVEKDKEPTALVNALAICSGAITGEKAKIICEKFVSSVLSPCSLSMKCFVYDSLIMIDKEKYKDYILEDIRKTYSPMIESGTVWETVVGESDFGGAGSLCHGWSSTPIYYFNILK